MKRSLLVLLGLLLVAQVSWAGVSTDDYETYTYDNNTNAYVTVNVATTTIVPGIHYIVGYSVMSLTGHKVDGSLVTGSSENVVSVWDESAAMANPKMIGPELEALDEHYEIFLCPRSKYITYGITHRQGPYTRVQILYEK